MGEQLKVPSRIRNTLGLCLVIEAMLLYVVVDMATLSASGKTVFLFTLVSLVLGGCLLMTRQEK
jgi:predicted phage tail protein